MVRLHQTSDDDRRGLNRTENLRTTPESSPDFQRLHVLRPDAESIQPRHRGLAPPSPSSSVRAGASLRGSSRFAALGGAPGVPAPSTLVTRLDFGPAERFLAGFLASRPSALVALGPRGAGRKPRLTWSDGRRRPSRNGFRGIGNALGVCKHRSAGAPRSAAKCEPSAFAPDRRIGRRLRAVHKQPGPRVCLAMSALIALAALTAAGSRRPSGVSGIRPVPPIPSGESGAAAHLSAFENHHERGRLPSGESHLTGTAR
jgi:hypothetical protein